MSGQLRLKNKWVKEKVLNKRIKAVAAMNLAKKKEKELLISDSGDEKSDKKFNLRCRFVNSDALASKLFCCKCKKKITFDKCPK